MEYIDNVYVINMDHSTDRLKHMEDQVDIIGKPFKRISAIVGKEMTKEEIKNVSNTFCSVFCTSSMIGIFMSHRKAWENVVNNNDRYGMIMEDDCSLIPSFQEDLKQCIDELFLVDPEWDFLYLGCFGGCDKNPDEYDFITKMHVLLMSFSIDKINHKKPNMYSFTPESPTGFHCYVVSQKCAKKLLKIMDKVSYHVDVAFLNQANKFNVYSSSKTLAYQYTNSEHSTQTENFPIILNKMFNNFECKKKLSYSYYLSAPIVGIYKYNVNSYLLFLLLITLIIPNDYKVYLGLVIGLYFIIELVVNISNYHYIMFWSICILTIAILKNIFIKNLKKIQ